MIEFKDLREETVSQVYDWVATLAGDLRPEDLAEIEATTGEDPQVALMASVMASDMAWVMLVNGTAAALYGTAPTTVPDCGLVWMMGTPEMDRHRIAVARASRPIQAQMHRRYACLWNNIDARNEKSMKWLRWCGFRLIEALPEYGREGRLFFTFARYEPHV